jgi:hypothetical protein
MGLLDDAIREHLELKRRRGADPDEVARQEDEALGDPRRGEFARPEAASEVADEEIAPEAPRPPVVDEAAQAPGPDAPAAYAAGHEPPAGREQRDEEPWLREDDGVDAGAGQGTAGLVAPGVEPEPEVIRPDDEPGADEDVLEETPDFLQETPEHDRLWFEQKPPRDFDFDN